VSKYTLLDALVKQNLQKFITAMEAFLEMTMSLVNFRIGMILVV